MFKGAFVKKKETNLLGFIFLKNTKYSWLSINKVDAYFGHIIGIIQVQSPIGEGCDLYVSI